MSYRTIADFYKEDKNINKDCVNYFTKRNLNEVERDKKESYYSHPHSYFKKNLNIENFSINNRHEESLKHQEFLKQQQSLKHQESLKQQEALKEQEFLKQQQSLKHREFLKNQESLKHQEFLKQQKSLKQQENSLKKQESKNEQCSCGHEEYLKKEDNEKCLNINLEEKKVSTLTSPEVWGPALWFLLHNSSYNYDEKASPLAIERMKNFILGLPIMIPCKNCREHATAHIEKNIDNLEDVCSGRDSLFNFFVDFHNHVNKRYNKPEISYSDAKKLYSGKGEITTFSYK
jgi:hypothetical protein